jgi:hypothetical protein
MDDDMLIGLMALHHYAGERIPRNLGAMADALDLVPDREVWRVAGWKGVRRIARLFPADREAAIRRVLERRE